MTFKDSSLRLNWDGWERSRNVFTRVSSGDFERIPCFTGTVRVPSVPLEFLGCSDSDDV